MPAIIVNGRKFRIEAAALEKEVQSIRVNDEEVKVEVLREPTVESRALLLRIEGKLLRLIAEPGDEAERYWVELNGKPVEILFGREESVVHPREISSVKGGPLLINAPMSGRIVEVKTTPGQTTEKGQSLMVLEAMKMENDIASPRSGSVREVYVKPGDLVKGGDRLCLIQ